MSTQPSSPARRIVVWVIVLGILIGVAYQWGDDIYRFVTGQDIMDDLMADLAARPRPTPTPVIGVEAAPPQSDAQTATNQPVISETEIGPDGFPVRARQHVLKYTVQAGDNLFGIAERFAIHPNTIFWANTETLQDNVHLIQIGTQLYILPVNGVYHLSDGTQTIAEIAAMYGVAPGDILTSEYNRLSEFDGSYLPPAGLRIVVPGGRREYISWRAPIRTGTQSGSANPEGSLHPGSCRQIYSGVGGGGNYMNPLGGMPYRLTQGFQPWHPGADLAAEPDTPIYAAETGVVVFAGWHRDGYGELVIIDHGDGWTTYYGHMSQRFVDCGTQVSKGQLIGAMGMSGNATGIHLHFEIRQNDVPQNPSRFIQFQDARSAQG